MRNSKAKYLRRLAKQVNPEALTKASYIKLNERLKDVTHPTAVDIKGKPFVIGTYKTFTLKLDSKCLKSMTKKFKGYYKLNYQNAM